MRDVYKALFGDWWFVASDLLAATLSAISLVLGLLFMREGQN